MSAKEPMAIEAAEKAKCWCGAVGTEGELFAYEFLDESCGGTGTLACYCGGDLCVCHYHGEAECYGCEDCNFGAGDDDGE